MRRIDVGTPDGGADARRDVRSVRAALSGGECFTGSGLAKTCDSRVVFSASKTF